VRLRSKRAGALLAAALLLGTAAIATAVTVRQGGIQITALAQVKPNKLPRHGTAPIAVFIAGHLQSSDGGLPPQLQRLKIDVNRHGLLQSRGLAVCDPGELRASTTERALSACGDALIGSGHFWANIVLPDQGAYPSVGRLLVFNGREGKRPLILAHIYTSHPFNTSFVIPFSIKRVSKGPYGTELSASLPEALGSWGYLNRIKLTLKRKYAYRGKHLSYFNAGCPAPGHAPRTSFALAYAEFAFAGRPPMGVTVSKSCAVRE
jgi:hypothetical protein